MSSVEITLAAVEAVRAGMSVYAAAKQYKLAYTTVWKALRRLPVPPVNTP
jgi:molybdenum-dependent DNA-binding transcriptional regulator ModE